jgi:hypothetical protein
MPVAQELIAEKSYEDLSMGDLDLIARMTTEQQTELIDLALAQEPPNTEIAAVVGGMCASRYFGYTEYIQRRQLLPSIAKVFPVAAESLNKFKTRAL